MRRLAGTVAGGVVAAAGLVIVLHGWLLLAALLVEVTGR